jgi:hypothetical protein
MLDGGKGLIFDRLQSAGSADTIELGTSSPSAWTDSQAPLKAANRLP